MDKKIELNEFIQVVHKSFGNSSIIPLLYGLAFHARKDFLPFYKFPTLILHGTQANGKTTLSNIIQKAFCKEPLFFYNSVKKQAAVTFFEYDGIAIIDEYSCFDTLTSNLITSVIEGHQIKIAKKESNSVHVITANPVIIINYNGTIDELDKKILRRSILIEPEINASAHKAFEDNFIGLPNFSIEESSLKKLSEYYKIGNAGLFQEFNNQYGQNFAGINEQLVTNYGILLCLYVKLNCIVDFPFSGEEVLEEILKKIQYHNDLIQ